MTTRKSSTARSAVATPAAKKPKAVIAKATAKTPKAVVPKVAAKKSPVKALTQPPSTPLPAPDEPKGAASTKAKPKLVRDSFTMPKAEYAVIDELKQRAAQLGRPSKKSELLRAGIKILNTMKDEALLAALRAVPTIKTGRPHKG